MATVTVTAAEVIPDSAATVTAGTAGATITAGQVVYLDTIDSEWKLADSNVSPEEVGKDGIGIALNGASDGQAIDVCTAGKINMGASSTNVAAGSIFLVGTTAGALMTSDDAAFVTGVYVTVVAVGTAVTDEILVQPIYTGATLP